MSRGYKQNAVMSGVTRFTRTPLGEVEMSRMRAPERVLTTMNAGDIVPVKYWEILPHDTFRVSLNDIIRQATTMRPTMDNLFVDFFAFWVPNRVVNESWKNVQGENTSGFWAAPEVNLAPLYTGTQDVQIPIGSIADYYGLPTQRPIKASVLQQMNDLKYRGYLEIFNQKFRSQNYQTPKAYSKLNVYEGFLQTEGSLIQYDGSNADTLYIGFPDGQPSDGSFAKGAIAKAVNGEGYPATRNINLGKRITNWSALDKPLKANKCHDWITSALPSPQKGAEVYFGIGDVADVTIDTTGTVQPFPSGQRLKFNVEGNDLDGAQKLLKMAGENVYAGDFVADTNNPNSAQEYPITMSNLKGIADLSQVTGVEIDELRMAIATKQVYETFARAGTRYREIIAGFFGLDTENAFPDVPVLLGRYRHDLDLYQVAQTSATQGENATGDLSAYGFTASNGYLFDRTFIEHGYVHVLAVIRHKNVYSTYVAPDNFRRGTLDFYLPPLANISEQPIRLATLNPFVEENGRAIGFQEAWYEYRYGTDVVSGAFRTMPADRMDESLSVWTYADDFDEEFEVVTGDWLVSNTEEVLNRTLDTPSMIDGVPTGYPQFKVQLMFEVEKQRPMPVYSVPGLDVI